MSDESTSARTPANEKPCSSCGESIKVMAEICPKCGVRQFHAQRVSKSTLILLTFFFGGLGIHKLYLGKKLQALLCFLFCWTFVPSIIAFVELITYLIASEDELDRKYAASFKDGSSVVVVVIAGIVALPALAVIVGIFAAIALPKFAGATTKAKVSEFRPVAKQIITLEEVYKEEHKTYTTNLEEIGFIAPSRSRFDYSVETKGEEDFVVHAKLNETIGSAQAGDEVVVDKDGHAQATGSLESIVK